MIGNYRPTEQEQRVHQKVDEWLWSDTNRYGWEVLPSEATTLKRFARALIATEEKRQAYLLTLVRRRLRQLSVYEHSAVVRGMSALRWGALLGEYELERARPVTEWLKNLLCLRGQSDGPAPEPPSQPPYGVEGLNSLGDVDRETDRCITQAVIRRVYQPGGVLREHTTLLRALVRVELSNDPQWRKRMLRKIDTYLARMGGWDYASIAHYTGGIIRQALEEVRRHVQRQATQAETPVLSSAHQGSAAKIEVEATGVRTVCGRDGQDVGDVGAQPHRTRADGPLPPRAGDGRDV